MTNALVVAGGALADAAFGDPVWLPHPVRAMGAACTAGERAARAWTRDDPRREFIAGGALTFAIVAGSAATARAVLAAAARLHPRARVALALALAWTTLAARDLIAESGAVLAALEADDLPRARVRLARIVGRDTADLDASEIARATIETLAESACDGIVAPLCALAVGGVPLAFAFKASNTLDSMIGHREAPYTFFGRVAARLDDVAAFVPARVTALAFCATTPRDARRAWTTWHRDGARHASPNAGQSEAALAGRLGVRLGGTNRYAGVPYEAPVLGAEFPAPQAADVRRARRAVVVATVACALACTAVRAACDARDARDGR